MKASDILTRLPYFKSTWRHQGITNWFICYIALALYTQFVWIVAVVNDPNRVIWAGAWPAALAIALIYSLPVFWLRRRGAPWLVLVAFLGFAGLMIIANLRSLLNASDMQSVLTVTSKVVLPGLIPMIACLPFVRSTKFVKARLRRQVAQARKSIDPELRSESSVLASARLCDLIIESAAPADGFVAVYSAVGSELSLDSLAVLLGAAGYRVAYPAILGEGHMEFYTPFGSDALDLDSLAVIADPMATWAEDDLSGLTPVAADELSVVVVPGVAFDYDCHRMGFGGGFYDRYLPRLNADSLAFGVCFDEQMVAALPVERHDQRLDAVVTPTACHQGSPSMIDQIKQRLNKEEQG